MTHQVADFEAFRPALLAHCYRMLASPFDADDAVQETMIRAWKGYSQFDGRSSLKSWLYRIATNVCLDEFKSRKRRVHPSDEGAPETGAVRRDQLQTRSKGYWVEPMLDSEIVDPGADPSEQALMRENIRLAFVASLQKLAPKQRAVLLMADVLDFSAAEIAESLDSSVQSTNSALQRARSALQRRRSEQSKPMDSNDSLLLRRYMEAFERFDVGALTKLMRADVAFSMPPYSIWLQGSADVALFLQGAGADCRESKLVPTSANSWPAFAQYRRSAETYRGWALVVLEHDEGLVTGITNFLDVEHLFPRFGFPMDLAAVNLGPPMSFSFHNSH